MAFGDPRSFSKLGMSLEEVRRKEAENKSISSEVSGISGMTRTAKRNYKDAMRSGRPQLALDIMNEAKKDGVNVNAPQPGRSDLFEAAGVRREQMKKQLGQTSDGLNPDRLLSFAEKDKKVRDEAIANRAPGSLSARQQFAADLERSDLIKSGDPAAMAMAYERGGKLNLKQEEIRGFLERKINSNPYEFGPDAGLGLSKTLQQDRDLQLDASKLNRPANPLLDKMRAESAARVNAAGDAVLADYNANELPLQLQRSDEMAAAAAKTDALYSQMKGNALGLKNREAKINEELSSFIARQSKRQASAKEDADFADSIMKRDKKNKIKDDISNRRPSSLLSLLLGGIDDFRRIDSSKKI